MGTHNLINLPDDPVKPLDEARALHPAFYMGQDRFEIDQRHLIAPGWQLIAPATEVAAPGDHILREIGGMPVIILRNGEGRLKGFFNICKHRAGPLAACDGKGAKRLRCIYHGWIYDLDGQLKIVPRMDEAKDFDHTQIRLDEIDVAEWCGMIWARAGHGVNFEDFKSGFAHLLESDRLSEMTFHHARTYRVAANWKIYIDNYLEGYHVPTVHPGLNSIIDDTDYRIDLTRHASVQSTPLDDEDAIYGQGRAQYVFIWPNTMLNILPGRVQTNRVIATGPDSCEVEFAFYYLPGQETRWKEDDEFSDEVQEEDRLICEHVQKGLASGVYEPGRLSPSQESALWHFQNLLRNAYGQL